MLKNKIHFFLYETPTMYDSPSEQAHYESLAQQSKLF